MPKRFGKKSKPEQGRRVPPSGSQRSSVFSYYAKERTSGQQAGETRRASNERKLKPTETMTLKQKGSHVLHNLPLIIATLVLLIGIIYNITLSSSAQVFTDSVTKDAEKYLREKSVYQSAVAEALGSSPLNHTKLTINTDSIADSLLAQFPELSDVSVTLPLVGTRPVVYLEAAEPALLLTSGDQAYVLDTRGVVLMDAKDFTSGDKLLRVVDQSGLPIEEGTAALSVDQMNFITELQRQLADKSIQITEVELPAEPQQLNVSLKDTPYYAKLVFSSNSRVAAGSLIAMQKYLDKENITPSKYVDLRVEERAYYK